jgi:hypothetical protein
MRVQELIELLQQQSPYKAVYFDLGDDSVDIFTVEDFGSCVLLLPESPIDFNNDDLEDEE